ncbi:MAG TPA: PKD domain-containing protein [Chloroflexota bacterium]|nr:PKD domain-containing protein [Chloroflexota bacterium]
MHWRTISGAVGLLVTAALVHNSAQAAIARACAIDGVPSLQADGTRAALNSTPRTRQNSAHWAMFVFPARFSPGAPIHFSEDLRELARTLPPEIVHGHWIWQWGDGGHTAGHVVLHRYARPGAYVVTVAVAVPHRAAFLFDTALVRVVR